MDWIDKSADKGHILECGCGKSFWVSLVQEYCSWDEFIDDKGVIVHHVDVKCPYCETWFNIEGEDD